MLSTFPAHMNGIETIKIIKEAIRHLILINQEINHKVNFILDIKWHNKIIQIFHKIQGQIILIKTRITSGIRKDNRFQTL